MSMALSPTQVTITTGPSVPPSSPGLRFHLNVSFVTSLDGLLTVSEMVLSIIVYALTVSSAVGIASLNLLMSLSFCYWLLCFFILLSESMLTKPVLPTTTFFLIFHSFGSVLYVFISIAHLAIFSSSAAMVGAVLVKAVYNADAVNAAGAMGLIAGAAHLFHTALIIKKMIS
ncbi:hypothetical protein MRX96_025498 [Rhipicephalus microplus]|uniref:uncharacterized protein LOC119177318 n=1 Tax=Rhipicephalus microplus TaxID=6941 RepID=UPI003F6C904F